MEITTEELKQKIQNGDKLIVDFHGVWCGPCKENSEVQLYTMDVDKNKEFVSSLGVRAIPTVKSFSGGKEVYSQPGMQMEGQIKQLVTNLING